MKVNPEQLRAVTHKSGPLLIVAGAGTGKTTVITERIKNLVEKQHVLPHQILALTFTEKAAAEMLERLDVVMPLGYEEPWVSTFHSFGDRILKAEGLDIGLDPSYKILTRSEQWILIHQNLFKFKLKYYRPLGNPTKFISALLVFFSRAQDENVSPKDLAPYAKKHPDDQALQEVTQAYETYQQLKMESSALDFGDLITQTIRLFKERPRIAAKYRQQFRHILIDEFQDTNFAQFELIKLIAPPQSNPNLVVVGDDDQAIYKFRGAAVSNILDFKNQYPKSTNIVLTSNYRSQKPILAAAYTLIQNNNPDRLEVKLNINKQLAVTRDQKSHEPPQIISLETEIDETEWIIKKVLELVARENYTYKDFAILARSNSQLETFAATLRRHGLPYQLIGNRGLFDQDEIRYLIHFLNVVANPKDNQSLFQLLHAPIFNLDPETILELIHDSRSKQISLWDAMVTKEVEVVQPVVAIIRSAQNMAKQTPPTKVIYEFLTASKYIQQYTEESVENALKIKNLNLFLNLLKKFETDIQSAKVVEAVDYLNLLTEAGENPAQAEIEDIDTIRLITLHSAKGLEFPVVFIPSLITGRFPAINRRDAIEFPQELIKETLPVGNENLQEERRLLYVGITRARDYLYLTHAADYGGARHRRPSGFLSETRLKTIEIESKNQLSLLTPPAPAPRVVSTHSKRADIKHLSYSQIDTFKTCPLKYKYRYVLQVPAQPHHALTFGQSVHDTLKHFHQLEQKGFTPTAKDLLKLYRQYFREEGYESPQHKQKRFDQGEASLKQYFKVYRQKLGKPIHLEWSFRLTIAGVPLIGKIDRIDDTPQGYEIVDYKTGDASKKDVDRDEQLTIYALGAKYSLNIEVSRLSLYFLESNEKLSTTRSEDDLQNALKHLEKTVEEIKQSDYPATPGYPFPCGFCEYNKICPYAAKKR